MMHYYNHLMNQSDSFCWSCTVHAAAPKILSAYNITAACAVQVAYHHGTLL